MADQRVYRCKDCNEPFPHPRAVYDHKVANHGAKPRDTSRKRKKAEQPPTRDPEVVLLERCIAAFDEAGTDSNADIRVLDLLCARYGREAYADPEQPEDAPL